jgi:hypothetical protein
MNEQSFVVTNPLWQRFEPHLPGKTSDARATAKDNRLVDRQARSPIRTIWRRSRLSTPTVRSMAPIRRLPR